METAVYQQVPTDEAEAQMLASADLDDMKSKRELSWFLGLRMQVKSTISYEIDDYSLRINADNSLLFSFLLNWNICSLLHALINADTCADRLHQEV